MSTLQVGELYVSSRTSWPEGSLVQMGTSGMSLVLRVAHPTPEEVRDARKGPPQFAWIDAEHTGILACQLGEQPWVDAPYTPHLDQPGGVPEGTQCTVVLLDAATGLVCSVRLVGLPAAFMSAVRDSVQRMAATSFSRTAYDATIGNLYARYPTAEDLVRYRADITCTLTETRQGGGPYARPAPAAPPPATGSPAALIASLLPTLPRPDVTYPAKLPDPLQVWYCYVPDSGHCIMTAVESLYSPGADPATFLVAAPVKAVLRDWHSDGGFVVADLPYDASFGVMTDDTDTEFLPDDGF